MNIVRYLKHSLLPLAIILLPAGLSAQGLYNKGARLILNGPVKLILQNAGFTNEGFFKAGSSTVVFTGGGAAHITGNTTFSFNHVTLGKSPGQTVVLHQDITINGTLTMDRGNLLLNNQTLFLGNAGSIAGESSQSYITGTQGGRIFLTRKVTTPLNAFNPGNIGVELTTAVAPGIMVIERRHVQESILPQETVLPPQTLFSGGSGGLGIQRSFTITAENNTDLNATLRFFYLDTELAGADETGLALWRDSDINSGLILAGSDHSDASGNWVEKNNLDRWGHFTLAGGAGTGLLMRGNDNADAQPNKEQSLTNPVARTTIQVYPNPSRDKFRIELFSDQEKDAVISLYDQSGRLLQQKKMHCRTGMNSISWDLGNYGGGVYYIVFKNPHLETIKIIKE